MLQEMQTPEQLAPPLLLLPYLYVLTLPQNSLDGLLVILLQDLLWLQDLVLLQGYQSLV